MRAYRRHSPPVNAHPFARQLFDEMDRQQIGVLDMAERAGVNKNTVKDWKTRSVPSIDNLQACLNVLGLRLTVTKVGRYKNDEL